MIDFDGRVAEAIGDLADLTGVDPAGIDLVAHEEVTWRDGSLGCPQPGMLYTQALVHGYRILLRASGQDYAYHGATGKTPFHCPEPAADGTVDPGSSTLNPRL